ncbi:hypothetical protein LEMA_P013590.1 [Plenodomus lingam JN3]|uniref:non-specific serine/threonine protein kinase n=1 Tax=Leptosphaeria maculans (strain JN3 / isolate v23.1.3 / race Av1-4-5-6-7-8) TaxID=985895 RepID=E5A988_LEPMJ|nr:hypothetical protein LEMA_P013590.1 [Plenodomus lingam JN3]CBY00229.1 hypothetical protein LEMA_P013590.1 [Plenodomus lingam JN3]
MIWTTSPTEHSPPFLPISPDQFAEAHDPRKDLSLNPMVHLADQSPCHEFTPIQKAIQGVGGAQNSGILITLHNSSGKVYIEKRIPLRLITQGDIRREVCAMQQCSAQPHPNIVRLITFELQSPYHIPHGSLWLQHCELGSLDALMLRYMRRGHHLADESFMWKVFFGLALAIAYLHTGSSEQDTRERAHVGKGAKMVAGWNPIIHRDLKPSNKILSLLDWYSSPLVLTNGALPVTHPPTRAEYAVPLQSAPVYKVTVIVSVCNSPQKQLKAKVLAYQSIQQQRSK